MKRFVTPALQAFLLSGPQAMMVADCYTLTLVTGEIFYLTSFDFGVSIAADAPINQPGATFTAMGSRIKRGRIQNKRGLETSQLDVIIGSDISPDLSAGALASPPSQVLGLSLGEATIAGLLFGATIRLETVYGNPAGGGLTRQSDGTYNDGGWGSVIKFIGIVADCQVVKQSLTITFVSNLHELDPYWPPFLIQPLCRWRLFDAGCSNPVNGTGTIAGGSPDLTVAGMTLVAATFVGRPITITGAGHSGKALVTSIKSVSSSSACVLAAPAIGSVSGAAVTVGLLASNFAQPGTVTPPASTVMQVYHGLTNPSGYFTSGRIVFVTGKNAGLTRQIKTAIGAGQGASYPAAVLADSPYFFYRLNESSGSVIHDSSPNGYNATLQGGVTLGQPSLLAGDTGTGALFDGSSGYLLAHAPKPKNWAAGISFDFWFSLSSGATADQPRGIFDTNNGAEIGGCRNNGMPNDSVPGFIWNTDRPFVGIVPPVPLVAVHCAVVFRGQNSMDVYINGQLYDTETTFGTGAIVWQDPFWIGKSNIAVYETTHYFDGILQDFAGYNYPLSADQVLTHYYAGAGAPIAGGAGVFLLNTPLIYAPAVGDQFVAYPGCPKTPFVCDKKFDNILQHGGQAYVPQPEAGL